MNIFMAGENSLTEGKDVWVASMGHLIRLFDKPWLGITPTGKITFLRCCELNRVEDAKIIETAMYFDIPHIMMQAGVNPFPPQTGARLVQPGPASHDGLMMEPQPIEEGKKNAVCYQRNDSRFGAVEQQSESLEKITPYMARRYDLVGTCRDRIDLYDSALLKTALRFISRILYGQVEKQSCLPYDRRAL